MRLCLILILLIAVAYGASNRKPNPARKPSAGRKPPSGNKSGNKPGRKKQLSDDELNAQVKGLPSWIQTSTNSESVLKEKDKFDGDKDINFGKPKLKKVPKNASDKVRERIEKENERAEKAFEKDKERTEKKKDLLRTSWDIGSKEFYQQIRENNSECRKLADALHDASKPIPFDLVRGCYMGFRYNDKIAAKTLDAVYDLLQLHVFTYESIKMSGFAVLEILNRIRDTRFARDWQFQEAVNLAMVPMFDGHLEYRPTCYRQFSFMQPMFLVGIVAPGGETRIYLHSVDAWENVGLKQYEGAEVVKINGQNAVEALQKYADQQYGKAKCSLTRFNRCLASRFWDAKGRTFLFDRGVFTRRTKLPDHEKVQYDFRLPNGKTGSLAVPWFASPEGKLEFKDAESYYRNYCAQGARGVKPRVNVLGEKAHGSAKKHLRPTKFPAKQGVKVVPPPDAQEEGGTKLSPQDPVAQGSGIAFFFLGGVPSAGVIVISTFATGSLKSWTQVLLQGFNAFNQLKVKYILLDLSNNSGGTICFAHLVTALFDRNPKLPFPIPNKPFLSSIVYRDFFQDLANYAAKSKDKNTSFLPTRFLDPATLKRYKASEWDRDLRFYEGTTVKVSMSKNSFMQGLLGDKGVPKIGYSRLLLDDCRLPQDHPLAQLKLPYNNRNVAVISNGYCGSACAMVATQLQHVGKFKTAFVSARTPGRDPPVIYAFPGGQKQTSDEIFELDKHVHSRDGPRPLPTSASLSFTYRKLYADIGMTQKDRDKKPPALEYTFFKADQVVTITPGNVLKPARIWMDALVALGVHQKERSWRCVRDQQGNAIGLLCQERDLVQGSVDINGKVVQEAPQQQGGNAQHAITEPHAQNGAHPQQPVQQARQQPRQQPMQQAGQQPVHQQQQINGIQQTPMQNGGPVQQH